MTAQHDTPCNRGSAVCEGQGCNSSALKHTHLQVTAHPSTMACPHSLTENSLVHKLSFEPQTIYNGAAVRLPPFVQCPTWFCIHAQKMAGSIPPQDPGSPEYSSEYSAAPPIKPPKRRADYIQPEPKKRKFIDGVPPSQPAKTLKKIVKRLKDGYYYTYSDLAPNEDIRILIVEKGSGSDTLYCKLVPSALPSTEGRVGPIPVYEYEALS